MTITLADADRITEASLTRTFAFIPAQLSRTAHAFADAGRYIQSTTVSQHHVCQDCGSIPVTVFALRYGDFRKVHVCRACAAARRTVQFS